MLNTKVEKVGQVWTLEKIKELIEKKMTKWLQDQ